jgi:hypothetical protein
MSGTKKKYTIQRLLSNPMGVYLLWFVGLIIFCFIGIPVLSIGHPGGEQRPFILLGYTMDVAVAGFIIISLMAPILYWSWFKKYMFIPLVIPLLIITLLVWWIVEIYLSNDHHFPL